MEFFCRMAQAVTSYDRIGDGNSQNAHVSRQQLDAYVRRIDLRTNEQALFNVLTDTNIDKTVPSSVFGKPSPGGNIR